MPVLLGPASTTCPGRRNSASLPRRLKPRIRTVWIMFWRPKAARRPKTGTASDPEHRDVPPTSTSSGPNVATSSESFRPIRGRERARGRSGTWPVASSCGTAPACRHPAGAARSLRGARSSWPPLLARAALRFPRCSHDYSSASRVELRPHGQPVYRLASMRASTANRARRRLTPAGPMRDVGTRSDARSQIHRIVGGLRVVSKGADLTRAPAHIEN